MDYGKLENINWNNQLPMGDNIKKKQKKLKLLLGKEFFVWKQQ